MVENKAYNNFASGELSPSVWGRIDRPFYATGVEVMRNFIPCVTGGTFFRRGFDYVHHTRLNKKAFFITFKFNASQSYTLEFTDLFMRVHKNGGVVLETAKNITGFVPATGVVTSGTHGFSTGDEVYFSGVVGTTELNGQFYLVVKVDADTFTLKDIDGNVVDTTGFTAYSSGGTVARVYTIASPYAEADLWQVKTAQTADLMYLVHPSYAPYKLTRSGHASWTLATYVRTADPFTGANAYPGAVGFYGGRLWMGATNNDPDVKWGSKGPDATTGASQYDNFTVGTAAGDALIYTLTSQNLTADRILWFGGTPAFMVIGTTGGLYKANGGADGAAITPTNISVTPVSSYGAQDIGQIFVGNQLVYVQAGGLTLRSFEYDLLTDNYFAYDKNILSEDITYPGIIQIVVSQGRPDLIWALRSDGVLLSCTFLNKEEIAGWARQYIGGNGKVLSIASEPQANAFDRLVICVERTIGGVTRRYVEYQSIDPQVPDLVDYYTAESAEFADIQKYRNMVFEAQKQFIRLDSALILDTTQALDLALSALTGSVTATAGGSLFEASDVGRYIFIKYLTGEETGVGVITAYISATQVTVFVKQDFSTLSIPASGWYLLADTVRGLGHLEGATIGVVTDGGVHADEVVADGMITLDYPARYIIIGLRYWGYIRTLDLEQGANVGVAQGRLKNVLKVCLKLHNTLGGKYGSTAKALYNMLDMAFRDLSQDFTDRPPMLFSGMKELTNFDDWDIEKRVHIVQDDPLPMTINSLIPVLDLSE